MAGIHSAYPNLFVNDRFGYCGWRCVIWLILNWKGLIYCYKPAHKLDNGGFLREPRNQRIRSSTRAWRFITARQLLRECYILCVISSSTVYICSLNYSSETENESRVRFALFDPTPWWYLYDWSWNWNDMIQLSWSWNWKMWMTVLKSFSLRNFNARPSQSHLRCELARSLAVSVSVIAWVFCWAHSLRFVRTRLIRA